MSRETLGLQALQLDKYAKAYPSEAMRATAKKGADLVAEYGTAAQSRQIQIEAEMTDLVAKAKETVSVQVMSWKEKTGIIILVGVFFLVGGSLVWYVAKLDPQKLISIESIRPVLVFGLIISTITFGAALIIGALYSEGETLEARFRHAREIFLVFSGIFGTVIGFYFGAGESKVLQQPVMITANLVGAKLEGQVGGGTPPYKVTLTYGTETKNYALRSTADRFEHVFDKGKDDIQAVKVEVVDSKDQKDYWTKESKPEDLKAAGWAKYQNIPSAPDKGGAADKKAGAKPQTEPGIQPDKTAAPPAPTAPVVPKKP